MIIPKSKLHSSVTLTQLVTIVKQQPNKSRITIFVVLKVPYSNAVGVKVALQKYLAKVVIPVLRGQVSSSTIYKAIKVQSDRNDEYKSYLVIQLPADDALNSISQSLCFDPNRCWIRKYLNFAITKCFQCQRLVHIVHKCKFSLACALFTGDHKTDDCLIPDSELFSRNYINVLACLRRVGHIALWMQHISYNLYIAFSIIHS